MSFETILTRVEGRTGVLTLNRPKVLNAFNGAMVREIGEAVRQFTADPQVLAIVIHGEGRAFSAGFDLKEAIQRKITTVAEWRRVLETDFEFVVQFWDCPKPTIAAVHGYC